MKRCSRCGNGHSRFGQRYCGDCHAANMRDWRRRNPLSEDERRKDICRSYTSVLVRRGHIVKAPCLICLAEPAQAHHPDYGDPRLVFWLCPEHHRAEHDALDARARGWGWMTTRSQWLAQQIHSRLPVLA